VTNSLPHSPIPVQLPQKFRDCESRFQSSNDRKHSATCRGFLDLSTCRRTSSLLPHQTTRFFSTGLRDPRVTTISTTRTSPFYVRAVRRSRETRGHWLRENLPPPPDECADRQCGVVGGLRGGSSKGVLRVIERERERIVEREEETQQKERE